MWILFLLAFPFLELYVLFQVGSEIGVINTLFALIASGVLGAGLARSQGFFLVGKLQTTLARGEVPTSEVLQALLVFIGGVLFLIPGFVSDFIGLVFVLPGTRHLVAAYVKRSLQRKLMAGGVRIFTTRAGGGGFSGFDPKRGPFGRPPFSTKDPSHGPRDVTPKVIDVTPISSESRRKSDPDRE